MSIDSLFEQIKINKNNNLNNEIKNNNQEEIIECIECKSGNLVEKYGNYVCKDCGVYNESIIDFKQEWRYYGSEDNKQNDPSRCGIPTNELLPQSSIGSVIGFGNNESNMMRRIRNMQYWNTIPYRESSLLESFNNISILSQNAGISSCIIEEAKYMYKRVSELKTSRRTKKEAMKAASIYLACQVKKVPRSCKEIAKIFNIDNVKIMSKSIKSFEEIWNSIKEKEKEKKKEENVHMTIKTNNLKDEFESVQYLHRYCSKLEINNNIYDYCLKLLVYIENEKLLETHNPLSRISSCLFYITEKYKLNISKESIIKICDVSEVTINKCNNKLLKYNNNINVLLS